MISFNKKDEKMGEIAKLSKIVGALTKEDYRVYGLRNSNNPPILIEYSEHSDVYDKLDSKCTKLDAFFKKNGIDITFGPLEDETEDGTDYKVYIGLRRDVRNDLPLTCALLKTIIYFIEDKIEIE